MEHHFCFIIRLGALSKIGTASNLANFITEGTVVGAHAYPTQVIFRGCDDDRAPDYGMRPDQSYQPVL